MLTLDITKALPFLPEGAVSNYSSRAIQAAKALEDATCAGNDFLGWELLFPRHPGRQGP